MKTTIKLALIGAVALGAATITSCNKGGEEPVRDEVQILLSVDGMTGTRAPQLDATGEGVFSDGDTFGLVVMAQDEVLTTKRFNYTVGSTKLYWDQMPPLAEGNNYAFMAVYPNVPEFNADNIVFDFNAAKAANPDMLITHATVAQKNGTVNLAFGHAMHKLNVNITSNYFSDEQLAKAQVFPMLKSTARVSGADGASPEGATTSNWVEYPVKTGANTSWIVAPQNLVVGNPMVRIGIGGHDITYMMPASLTTLGSGKVTTLKLDLHRDLVSLEGKDVGQWGNETEVPGTIPVTE